MSTPTVHGYTHAAYAWRVASCFSHGLCTRYTLRKQATEIQRMRGKKLGSHRLPLIPPPLPPAVSPRCAHGSHERWRQLIGQVVDSHGVVLHRAVFAHGQRSVEECRICFHRVETVRGQSRVSFKKHGRNPRVRTQGKRSGTTLRVVFGPHFSVTGKGIEEEKKQKKQANPPFRLVRKKWCLEGRVSLRSLPEEPGKQVASARSRVYEARDTHTRTNPNSIVLSMLCHPWRQTVKPHFPTRAGQDPLPSPRSPEHPMSRDRAPPSSFACAARCTS